MAQLVEFELEDGGHVLMEVQQTSGLVTRGFGTDVREKAAESFDKSVARVKPAADALLSSLADLAQRPDEVTVEFGLSFSAEAGAFIGGVGAGANFKVGLKWTRRSDPGPDA